MDAKRSMKCITADEKIHITHWEYALNGRLLSIIYEKDGAHERHIKFLRSTHQLDAYLLNHLQTWVSVSALNAIGAEWVDEEPFFEIGVEVPVEVDDCFTRFCAQNGITVFEYLYGLSCYLCNPANYESVMAFLNETMLQIKADMSDNVKST